MAKVRTIGRDAETGQFIPAEEARRRSKTAVLATVPVKRTNKKRKRK